MTTQPAPTIPASRAHDAALPPAEQPNCAYEGAAYIAAVTRTTLEKSERETVRDCPAVRVGRYCVRPGVGA